MVLLTTTVRQIKFVYSEKAMKFCKISTLLLFTVHADKSKVEILQKLVAFSEYVNFTMQCRSYSGGAGDAEFRS